MKIKLIVTDLDGTLFCSDHTTIPQRNIEAFKRAHDIGVKIAIASGRTKILADYLPKEMPFIDYLITSNGAVTYDTHSYNTISTNLITAEKADKIYSIIDNYKLPYEVYFQGKCYMNENSRQYFTPENIAPEIYNLLHGLIEVVPDLSALAGENGIEKINILSLSPVKRKEIEAKLSKIGGLSFASSFAENIFGNTNLEMTDICSTKGFAIKRLAGSLNITKDEIMCFGDGENDCSMLEFAEWSFAMGNAGECARNSAKYLTDTNDNAGVSQAVEKYVLGL